MTTFAGHFTRSALSLSDLAIGTGTPYRVLYEPSFDAGTVTRRRTTVTSPYVHGELEIGSVMSRPFAAMRINVQGSSQSAIASSLGALIAAVTQQSSYTLAMVLDGTTYSWTCYPADYGVGFTQQLLIGLQCPVSLSIPRDPIPVSGPI